MEGNASDGIRLDTISSFHASYNTLTGNFSSLNGGYGVNIQNVNCTKNIVDTSINYNNTSGTINDAGTSSVLGDNTG